MNAIRRQLVRIKIFLFPLVLVIVAGCTSVEPASISSPTNTPVNNLPTQGVQPSPTTNLEQEDVMELRHRLSPAEFGLEDHAIVCVAWSPDGNRVAMGTRLGSLIVWDSLNGNLLHHLSSGERIDSCDWSANGDNLVSTSGPDLWMWDPLAGIPVQRVHGIGGLIKGVVFSPDSTMLASWAYGEKSGRIWDTTTGAHLFALPHRDELNQLTWSPDSSAIASSTRDQLVTVWNSADGQSVVALGHDGIVFDIAWSPDGLLLAVGHSTGVTIWDARTWTQDPMSTLEGESASYVEWSPDGRWIAFETGILVGEIEVWEVMNEVQVYSLATTGAVVRDISWSPDGHWLAAALNNSMAAVWDMNTGIWVGHPIAERLPQQMTTEY
jgi:WD40 repeat protein